MKKLLFIISGLLIGHLGYSQVEVGLKGGINYNSNGDLNITGGLAGISEHFESERKAGYHGGFFVQIPMSQLYLRPEVVYSKTKSEYQIGEGETAEYNLAKVDGNILLGLEVLGPLHIFAGPSIQHIFKSELDDTELDPEHDFNVGLDFGLGLNLGRFGADVRFERGLTENEASFFDDVPIDGFGYVVDTRPKQVILSFNYTLGKSSDRN